MESAAGCGPAEPGRSSFRPASRVLVHRGAAATAEPRSTELLACRTFEASSTERATERPHPKERHHSKPLDTVAAWECSSRTRSRGMLRQTACNIALTRGNRHSRCSIPMYSSLSCTACPSHPCHRSCNSSVRSRNRGHRSVRRRRRCCCNRSQEEYWEFPDTSNRYRSSVARKPASWVAQRSVDQQQAPVERQSEAPSLDRTGMPDNRTRHRSERPMRPGVMEQHIRTEPREPQMQYPSLIEPRKTEQAPSELSRRQLTASAVG